MKIQVAILALAMLPATTDGPSPDDHERPVAPADAGIVDRFLGSGTPALTSYRAHRVLDASSRGGRITGTLEVWTTLSPDGRFDFEIIREEGSGLIRRKVLHAALEAEQRSRNEKETQAAELTPANYEFTLGAAVAPGALTLELLPRRRSPMLLIGSATIAEHDGDLLSVEGRLSKSPSFWTKRVDVVRRYARIAGVRVPVEMRSRADVRIAGASSFSMVYAYESINGQPVRQGSAQAP